jgi:hypothetical protein
MCSRRGARWYLSAGGGGKLALAWCGVAWRGTSRDDEENRECGFMVGEELRLGQVVV